MHQPLSLKYRPKTLSSLVGQDAIKTALTNAVTSSKIAPAYLFTGPRGTGKTSTARILAKSLNCLNSQTPTATPCNKCASCKAIDAGNSLDVSEIDAASHNGVEDARQLIERSNFAPAMSRYRLFILDECLAGDSLVLTDSGQIRIDDSSIVGKPVLSYNESNDSWGFKPVLNWVCKGRKPVYEIRTNNHVLRCTGNHPIRTSQGWVKAENLEVGMTIISPKTLSDCAGWNLYANRQSHQWSTNLEEIQSIGLAGQELVYDIEVADNHNFVANGLLVHNCHQLSSSAQNALLKCIEEPPVHVVFILCTTEAHKVLPTIASRCQTFNFKALSIEAIIGQLHQVAKRESIAIVDEALTTIARHSDGGLRDALQLLSQLSLMGVEITSDHVIEVSGGIRDRDLAGIVQAICAGDVLTVLQSARMLIDSGKTPKLILSSLLAVYRDLLIVKSVSRSQNLITGSVGYSQLRQVANTLDLETIDAALTQLQKSESQLRTTVNAATWLEVCLLNLIPQGEARRKSTYRLSPSPSQNLDAVWNSVVEVTKPANRGLLSRAQLLSLNNGKCVLAVSPSDVKKFKTHIVSVERIVSKALGYSVVVVIEQIEEISA